MKVFEEIRQFYLQKFQEQGEDIIPIICNLKVAQAVFLNAYENVEQIEELPEKEKLELKKYVIELFPNKDAEFRLMACKIIQAFGTLINI